MTVKEYQELAARTINHELTPMQKEYHALHGMAGEIGEIHSLYQKAYQGHEFAEEHVKKEFGDLLWFIAEYCTACGWELEEIMQMNIDKLKKRYPEGFSSERSQHRETGDI
jgi:NTP pyrophosphatase (non-canonical NTP hydrolase)